MEKKLKLTIELIPNSSFEQNLRYQLTEDEWDVVRKQCYKKYRYMCGVCGKTNTILSAHEEWSYNLESKIQKLENIISLCTDCHMIKHIGFADELASQGKLDMVKLVEHFIKVNKCTMEEFTEHYLRSVAKWRVLSNIKWTLDTSKLKELGGVQVV